MKKPRQLATGDRIGRARNQQGEKSPPRYAKYNIHACYLLGVEWHGYGISPETTPSVVYSCEALGGTDWFHRQKQKPERSIHYVSDVHVHFGAGGIWGRVYANIYKQANDHGPHIWPNFVLLLPSKCFQVETLTESVYIFSRNLEIEGEGDHWARNWTGKGNSHNMC